MFEWILAVLALAGMAVYGGVIAWYVERIDLAVVIVVVILMAAFDFIRELNSKTRLARNYNSRQQRDQI